MRVLLLGGTAEALALAEALIADGVDVTTSLAGRVAEPRRPAGRVRVGGFGGIDGLRAEAARFDAVVDATHPFSERISANAAGACTDVPLLRLERPGWTGSATFSDAALTPASRAAHVKSCLDMWLKGNLPGLPAGAAKGIFDGIDLDWEWPGSEGNVGNDVRPQDKQNFTALAQEFRKQLDAYGRSTGRSYLLTAFLPAAPAKIDAIRSCSGASLSAMPGSGADVAAAGLAASIG